MKRPFLLCCLLATSALTYARVDWDAENPAEAQAPSFETRLIFHAVLEGLYETGVDSEDLKMFLPKPDTMIDTNDFDRTNFIYACPICMPTFDALRLYAARKPFHGQKGTRYNTFGPGLDPAMKKALHGDPQTRRDTIRALIDQWVHTRLDNLNLDGPRRAAIDENLKKMREEGNKTLKAFKFQPNGFYGKVYADWDRCFACDGACAVEK